MARVVLLGGSDGTVTALRAVAGSHAVVAAARGDDLGDADLVVLESGRDLPFAATDLDTLPSPTPLLLLVDDLAAVDTGAFGKRPIAVLKKPFDLTDLRLQIRDLLETRSEPAARSAEAWLEVPLISTDAAATLSAARRLGGCVWIVGEAGTGSDRVAAALARSWDADREPVVWAESDSLASAASRLGDADRVLWVPAVDERPLREQRALERLLATDPARRMVVTAGDDPGEAVRSGTLLRSLHDALSRLALRLVPLRERSADIGDLATAIGSGVCAAFGAAGFRLTDDARRTLENYPWPGNLTELEAAITRSTVARASVAGAVVELDGDSLRFASGLWPGAAAQATADAASESEFASATTLPAPRRAVVLAMDAARAGKTFDASLPLPGQGIENATVGHESRAHRDDASGVEALLAAFAHDIRNPMSTIKTFAGLQAASAGADDAELAGLALEACERVDEQLEFLQRYAELAPGAASRIDLVETLGGALDAAAPARLVIAARTPLWVNADPALARFVADAVVAECRSRLVASPDGAQGPAATAHNDNVSAGADLAADGAFEIRIPVGGAAVDRLGKWVDGRGLPWRIALAREAARRAGGELEVSTENGEMRLRWRLPLAKERSDDDQAGSSDRRRRSRSS